VALAQLGFPNAVATLGTACTAEHVQKLFRFTDSVIFSFDGDAAGRRAAGRALEAAMPHATDTRSVKFLFLPAEHDPDSYVREFGADGFEQKVLQAVPLSRQLMAAAQDGCDIETAEGRARFLANARPLWAALPDGALKRQMLGELAGAATLALDDLLALWGAGGDRVATPVARPAQARRARGVRQGATSLLDRALWLLVHRVDIWGELEPAIHDLLAEQAAPYGELFGAIERNLLEHGAQAPPAVLSGLREAFGGEGVVARIEALHEPDPASDLHAELRKAVDGLRLQEVDDELKLLFESGTELSPEAQQRASALMKSRASLKAARVGQPG